MALSRSLFLRGGGKLPAGIALAMLACSGGSSSSPTAKHATCGNGKTEMSESCDDGNAADGDGCSKSCSQEPGWDCYVSGCVPHCGDQFVVGNEVCDELTPPPGELYCKTDCSGRDGSCGDGIVQRGNSGFFSNESCDTGGKADPGCDGCVVVFGYVCSGAPSNCGQTGLDPNKLMKDLTSAEQLAYCTWITTVTGTPGSQEYCNGKLYTVYSPGECVANLDIQFFGTCTVGAVEKYVISLGNVCSVLTAPAAC